MTASDQHSSQPSHAVSLVSGSGTSRCNVDVAIIGAGSAGMAAYKQARREGMRTLLIENGPYGTMCARVGCMPSKLLIAAAEAAHSARQAGLFGVRTGPVQIDDAAVMTRLRRLRDTFVAGVVQEVESMPTADRLKGTARFTNAHTLQVELNNADNAAGVKTCTVTAKKILIATGTTPFIPDALRHLPRFPYGPLVTSDDVFEYRRLPSSVAVIGSGAIGLELGQALSRLGVRVELIARGTGLGGITDPAVAAAARHLLGQEMVILSGAIVESASYDGAQATLTLRHQDGTRTTRRYDAVLCAAGRQPSVAQLELQHTGLKLNDHGVPEHDPHTLQCGDSAIYLAGDVTNDLPVQHVAATQGRQAVASSDSLLPVPLTMVFTDPQIARVGQNWASLSAPGPIQNGQKEGIPPFVTGKLDFHDQGRSAVMGRNAGLMHLYVARDTHKLLGAELAGPDAEHLAHLLAWSCQLGLTCEQMLVLPFYHPTIEEGIRSALRHTQKQLT